VVAAIIKYDVEASHLRHDGTQERRISLRPNPNRSDFAIKSCAS
jgi:hypothetical protein